VCKARGIDGEQRFSNCELDCRDGRIFRINPPTRGLIHFRPRDGLVDRVNDGVIQKAKGCCCIRNGSIIRRAINIVTVDHGGGRVEHPTSLGRIDGCVDDVGFIDAGPGGVDNAEAEKPIGIAFTQHHGEERLIDEALLDEVLNWCLQLSWIDLVKGWERETKEAIVETPIQENGVELGCNLDSLSGQCDVTELDGIGVDVATCA